MPALQSWPSFADRYVVHFDMIANEHKCVSDSDIMDTLDVPHPVSWSHPPHCARERYELQCIVCRSLQTKYNQSENAHFFQSCLGHLRTLLAEVPLPSPDLRQKSDYKVDWLNRFFQRLVRRSLTAEVNLSKPLSKYGALWVTTEEAMHRLFEGKRTQNEWWGFFLQHAPDSPPPLRH
jgi:hypothetical protein